MYNKGLISRATIRDYLNTLSPLEQRKYFDKFSKSFLHMIKSGAAGEGLKVTWDQYRKDRNDRCYYKNKSSNDGNQVRGERKEDVTTAEEEDALRTSLDIFPMEHLEIGKETLDEIPSTLKRLQQQSSEGEIIDAPMLMAKWGMEDRTLEMSKVLRDRYTKYPPMDEFIRYYPPILEENVRAASEAMSNPRKMGRYLKGSPGSGKSYMFEVYYALQSAGLALNAKWLWWPGNSQMAFNKKNFEAIPITEQRMYYVGKAEDFGGGTAPFRGSDKDQLIKMFRYLTAANPNQIVLVLDELFKMAIKKSEGDQKAREGYGYVKDLLMTAGNIGAKKELKVMLLGAEADWDQFKFLEGEGEGLLDSQTLRRIDPDGKGTLKQRQESAPIILIPDTWTVEFVADFVTRAVPGWLLQAKHVEPDYSKMTPAIRSKSVKNTDEAIQLFAKSFFERTVSAPGVDIASLQGIGIGTSAGAAFMGNIYRQYEERVADQDYAKIVEQNNLIRSAIAQVETSEESMRRKAEALMVYGITRDDIRPLTRMHAPRGADKKARQDFFEKNIAPMAQAIVEKVVKASIGKTGLTKISTAPRSTKPTTPPAQPGGVAADPEITVEDDDAAPKGGAGLESAQDQSATQPAESGQPGAGGFADIQKAANQNAAFNEILDYWEENEKKIARRRNQQIEESNKRRNIADIVSRNNISNPPEAQDVYDMENLSDFLALKKTDVWKGYAGVSPEITKANSERVLADNAAKAVKAEERAAAGDDEDETSAYPNAPTVTPVATEVGSEEEAQK